MVGRPETRSVEVSQPGAFGRLFELALTFLGIAGFLYYPIGMLVLSLQLWNSYVNTFSDALYAAYLALGPSTVVRIWSFLICGSLATGIVHLIAAAITMPSVRRDWANDKAPLHSESERESALQRRERIFDLAQDGFFLSASVGVSAPLVLQPILFNSWRTWVLYAAFVALSCAGGIATGLLGLYTGNTTYPGIYGNGKAHLVAYAFGIVAGIVLAGTSIPSFPLVALDTSTGTQKGWLLAHTDGYWYVFDTQKGLKAVSNVDASNVRFLRNESQPMPDTLKRQ